MKKRRCDLLLVGCLGFLLAVPALSKPSSLANSCTEVTLSDLYGGMVTDLFERAYSDFNAQVESVVVAQKHIVSTHTFDGMTFTGFPHPDTVFDPTLQATWDSRIRLELYIPRSWKDDGPPLTTDPFLHVIQIDGGNQDPDHEKRKLARLLARKEGAATAIWSEDELGSIAPIRVQSGYDDQNELQRAGFEWMMAAPQPLTVEALRYDFRFATGQGNILCTTYFRRYLALYLASGSMIPQTALEDWLDRVDVAYDAGSKAGGGAMTAAGLDSVEAGRAVGLRIASYQVFDDGPGNGLHRLETDWSECADDNDHFWEAFAMWAYDHRDDCPSYFNTYVPARDPQPYENLLILDIVGTHDWIFPLGSSEAFWRNHPTWNTRILRRINKDHGRRYFPESGPAPDFSAGEIGTWRLMSHLANGSELPHLELLSLNASPTSTQWTVTVRLNGKVNASINERYRVWVAFSDERDFRRCTSPIEISPKCKDPLADIDLDEEDKFIKAHEGVEIDTAGMPHTIVYDRPVEWGAFPSSTPPLTAIIVEVRVQGPNSTQVLDDLYLHTDVVFVNEAGYPPITCP